MSGLSDWRCYAKPGEAIPTVALLVSAAAFLLLLFLSRRILYYVVLFAFCSLTIEKKKDKTTFSKNMLIPKNRKYRKSQKSVKKSLRSGRFPHQLTFGSYGLKSLNSG